MTQNRRPVRTIPPRADPLADGYRRWLDPLHAYVSGHVPGREVRERIVREVLSENLDLLVGRRDEALEVSRLEATANRLIAEVMTGEDVSRNLPASLSARTAQSRPR